MKKILLLIALSFLLVPNITQAQQPEDFRAEIDELNDLLEDIMERIEALEKMLDSDDSVENNEDEENTSDLSPALELEKKLEQQDIVVEDVMYVVQSETRKGLYPDALSAVMTNNTNIDIKHIRYAFVAWDSNGLPLKIEGDLDFSGGYMLMMVLFTMLTLFLVILLVLIKDFSWIAAWIILLQ